MITLSVNGQARSVDVAPETPLLWVLRDTLGLTGTKFGCGMALCGSCTVHLDGQATRSCVVPVSSAQGKQITTIEGLSPTGLHPVQQAFLDEGAFQCAYCTPGFVLTAVALLKENPSPSDEEIREYLSGNLCRCGSYQNILQAVRAASQGKRTG